METSFLHTDQSGEYTFRESEATAYKVSFAPHDCVSVMVVCIGSAEPFKAIWWQNTTADRPLRQMIVYNFMGRQVVKVNSCLNYQHWQV